MIYREILKDLEKWKDSDLRKPMILRGARQVGKTTVVNEFAKQFKQYIYISLEEKKYQDLFQEYDGIEELTTKLFVMNKKSLSSKKETLLFIDEIQEVPKAINFLRYFKEEVSELPVIAAGSMLETLLGKNITFPVGRVTFRILRPISFKEFIIAMGYEQAFEEFNNIPLNDFAHQTLLTLFHTYALIGGMPEVVQHYVKNKDVTALGDIYNSLIDSYLGDAEKYAVSKIELQLIRFTIQQSLHHAGKRLTFEGFGNGNYKSREIGETLRTLEKTHLLHLIYPTVSTSIPAIEDYRKSPRLQFFDTGLVNYFVGLQNDILGTKDLNLVYKGTLIEHLVGQEILSFQSFPLDKLKYWVRQKNSSSAEVDFIFPYKGKLVPIEVKSGSIGKIKSLQIFMEESPLRYAIRFFAGEFALNKVSTQNGKEFFLLDLPYYLASKIEDYIDWLEETLPTRSTNIISEPRAIYKVQKPKEKTPELEKNNLPEKYLTILKYCSSEPKKGKEIIEILLQKTYQSRNKKIFLKPLLDLELLEFTNKEYIKSKEQAYQLTEKGKEVLAKK
ncbi:MAG: ATP-binding protein [Flavobacteriia bacterium]|nr:ATP-binding protein [Flavobacteriia bacterium]